ncbi:MAG: tyrosine-type recombinase/integrase [Methylocystis sp.]|uniref:tyrosine-type recombinase/integrase n=1 Tax=Methylocystis sp. TaxID=1911079 RepID=UPI003DA3B42A
MARMLAKLSPLGVKRATKPGLYSDGGGLYLQIAEGGSKSWIFRYGAAGKRYLGLGPLHTIGLAEARERALAARRMILDGIDPIAAKREKAVAAHLAAAKSIAFKECAAAYIEAHKAGWKNAKHAAQWTATLETYAFPIFGRLPVASIDTALVLKALQPIWTTKAETASRVRGRIESILDWARVQGYREGENPARWKGHLDHLLPAKGKVAKVEHHAALPFAELPAFMADLKTREGNGARALEFAILTAARSGEVRGATWDEIDFDARFWTVPADRMKAGREHRVPLSKQAIALLRRLPSNRRDDALIFQGAKKDSQLSDMSLTAVLRRMGRGDLTAHGFRSTFRDWCAERTDFPAEVAEMALAHTVGNKVEAAYRRGDLFERRRDLMQTWGNYCDGRKGRR